VKLYKYLINFKSYKFTEVIPIMFSKAFTKTIIFYLFLIFLSQLSFKAPSVKAYGGLANVAQAPVAKKVET
jgi:hypothetical protein